MGRPFATIVDQRICKVNQFEREVIPMKYTVYNHLVVILAGVLLIVPLFAFNPSQDFEWTVMAHDVMSVPGGEVILPIYFSNSDSVDTTIQFFVNFCQNGGNQYLVMPDSVTFLGNDRYTTLWDTCCTFGWSMYYFLDFNHVQLTFTKILPEAPPISPSDDFSIICLVFCHVSDSAVPIDTIDIDLSNEIPCTPRTPDTLHEYIDANFYIVPYLYTRGDVNVSGGVPDIADAIFLARKVISPFQLPCQRAADCNLDGDINVADVIALVNYLYMGGTLPEPSYPNTCGYNFQDTLPCDEFPPCGYGGD